jgi:hypothetical protein
MCPNEWHLRVWQERASIAMSCSLEKVDAWKPTRYITLTERTPKIVPDTSTGNSVSQASGRLSGPGMRPSPRAYAARRASGKGPRRMEGQYKNDSRILGRYQNEVPRKRKE